jgi:hypothetical protein
LPSATANTCPTHRAADADQPLPALPAAARNLPTADLSWQTLAPGETMTSATQLAPDQIVERNLRVVEEHFHNENPAAIDKAVAVYAPEVVWEAPARGVILRSHDAVKQAYLNLFASVQIHSITAIRRVAAANWVFDDSVAEGG